MSDQDLTKLSKEEFARMIFGPAEAFEACGELRAELLRRLADAEQKEEPFGTTDIFGSGDELVTFSGGGTQEDLHAAFFTCNGCQYHFIFAGQYGENPPDYCPNCGRKEGTLNPYPAAAPPVKEEGTRSSTWGDLPQTFRDTCGLEPHEWDNMNTSQQRDWLLSKWSRGFNLADVRESNFIRDEIEEEGTPQRQCCDRPTRLNTIPWACGNCGKPWTQPSATPASGDQASKPLADEYCQKCGGFKNPSTLGVWSCHCQFAAELQRGGEQPGARCPKCRSKIDSNCWANGDRFVACEKLHQFPINVAEDFAQFFPAPAPAAPGLSREEILKAYTDLATASQELMDDLKYNGIWDISDVQEQLENSESVLERLRRESK